MSFSMSCNCGAVVIVMLYWNLNPKSKNKMENKLKEIKRKIK